jgi:hypothetical protein
VNEMGYKNTLEKISTRVLTAEKRIREGQNLINESMGEMRLLHIQLLDLVEKLDKQEKL